MKHSYMEIRQTFAKFSFFYSRNFPKSKNNHYLIQLVILNHEIFDFCLRCKFLNLQFVDPLQQTLNGIRSQILNEINRPWVPHFCRCQPEQQVPFKTKDIFHRNSNGGIEYSYSQLSSASVKLVVPSLLEKHALEKASQKYGRKVCISPSGFVSYSNIYYLCLQFSVKHKLPQRITEHFISHGSTKFALTRSLHHSVKQLLHSC
jgi:hypothetical protein